MKDKAKRPTHKTNVYMEEAERDIFGLDLQMNITEERPIETCSVGFLQLSFSGALSISCSHY